MSLALDGLGLYVDDLLLPASELMRNPTIWSTNLEKNDKDRLKAFDMLSQARMDWAVFACMALGRASGDVRAYVLNPKKRMIETTASSSSATKEIGKTSPDEF